MYKERENYRKITFLETSFNGTFDGSSYTGKTLRINQFGVGSWMGGVGGEV